MAAIEASGRPAWWGGVIHAVRGGHSVGRAAVLSGVTGSVVFAAAARDSRLRRELDTAQAVGHALKLNVPKYTLTYWPDCPQHPGAFVRAADGWCYCQGVGWHTDPAFP